MYISSEGNDRDLRKQKVNQNRGQHGQIYTRYENNTLYAEAVTIFKKVDTRLP